MTIPTITQRDLDAMKNMFHKDTETGMYIKDDRSGVYLKYFEMTGSSTAVKAASASTFSGFYGATDEIVNKLVEYWYPEKYPVNTVDFSRQITESMFVEMQAKLNVTGNAYLNEIELLESFKKVWVAKELGEEWPGNPVLAVNYLFEGELSKAGENFFSAGTLIDVRSVVFNIMSLGTFLDGSPIREQDLNTKILFDNNYKIKEAVYNGEIVSYVVRTGGDLNPDNDKTVHVFDSFNQGRQIALSKIMHAAMNSEEGAYIYIPYEFKSKGLGYLNEGKLLQQVKNPTTGKLELKEVNYPTPNPEADNPPKYTKFDITTGKSETFVLTPSDSLRSLATYNHMTVDQLVKIAGNTHLADRIVEGPGGIDMFLAKKHDVVYMNPVDHDGDVVYRVLKGGSFYYDPLADNPDMSGSIDNSHLNLIIKNGGGPSSGGGGHNESDTSFLDGLAADDGTHTVEMKPEVLNGDGIKHVAASHIVSDGVRPGAMELSTFGHVTSLISSTFKTVVGGLVGVASSIMSGIVSAARSFLNIDPLVVDLNGDGVRLTNFQEKAVFFDTDNDGFKEQTGWVSDKDGLVVMDKDGFEALIVNPVGKKLNHAVNDNIENAGDLRCIKKSA